MLNTILVPTDGSDHAKKAVTIASDIAAKYESRIIFLHVVNGHPSTNAVRNLIDVEKLSDGGRAELERVEMMDKAAAAGGEPISVQIPISATLMEEVGDVLLADAESVARDHNVKSVSRTRKTGDAASSILESAKEAKADMIVMGSRGLSDLKGLFVGSVSHKVSHLSECTCVTVK